MDIDGLFANMATAKVFGSGSYFEKGQYLVEVKDMFANDGHKGKSFITEFTVIESSNPEIPAGSTRGYVLKFENMYTMANATKLVMALLGYEPSKENLDNKALRDEVALITKAVLGSKTAQAELGDLYSDGMLKGVRVKLECTEVPTKPKDGKPAGKRTDHAWSPVTPNAT